MPASGFLTLGRLPLVLEHGRAALDFPQSVAIPDELRTNPELRLDAERGLEQQRGFGNQLFGSYQEITKAAFRYGSARRPPAT